MRKASRAFLGKLLSAPGPSGYEDPVRKVRIAEVEKHQKASAESLGLGETWKFQQKPKMSLEILNLKKISKMSLEI